MALEQLSRHHRQDETAAHATGALLAHFADDRAAAVRRYRRFVAQGIGADSVWTKLNRRVFLGDDDFVARMQALCRDGPPDSDIVRAQQRPPAAALDEIASRYPTRDAAIAAAHATGAYSYQRIAEAFGVHFTTVGRIVRDTGKGAMV